MKDLDTRVCSGVTFKFALFEPCQKYIERDRAGKSSKKRAVVDGHSDNLSSIKKLL